MSRVKLSINEKVIFLFFAYSINEPHLLLASGPNFDFSTDTDKKDPAPNTY